MKRGVFYYIFGRFMQSVMVLWIIVTLLFLLFRLAPSNPLASYIDTTFTKEQEATLLARFGLDKPLHEQYIIYLVNLVKLDLGETFSYAGKSVLDILRADLPNTMYLTLSSLLVAYVVGVLGGIAMAAVRGSVIERVGTTFTLMTRAAPSFWVGMLLLTFFAFQWKLLPSAGIGPRAHTLPLGDGVGQIDVAGVLAAYDPAHFHAGAVFARTPAAADALEYARSAGPGLRNDESAGRLQRVARDDPDGGPQCHVASPDGAYAGHRL